MATLEITQENLDETLNRDGIIVLDWWAPWCGPCQAFAPIFERVSAKYPDVVFGKINTEEQRELAHEYEIRSIPMLMVVRDGVVLYAEPGMLAEVGLVRLIEEARKADIAALKRERGLTD